MPFGERQRKPLMRDEAPTTESVLKQCIMLLYIHGKLSVEETEQMIAELGLKHA